MNNMNGNEITCDICRDLIPLVKDGVASADSETAVRRHIESCRECAALFDEKPVSEMPEISKAAPNKALLRVKRRLTCLYAVIMLLGIYFGLSLTASDELFLNCLIMPIAGVLGYLVFRWKAVFIMPVILLIVQVLTNELGLLKSGKWIEFEELLKWVFFYCLFALAGMIITMLLRFAFGKDKSEWGGRR